MKYLFLSCEELMNKVGDEVQDDQLLITELKQNSDEVTTLPWTHQISWQDFDRVLIRTTWDYATRSGEFLRTLQEIENKTKLFNSFEVVKWNIHKGYLKDLESKGICIVPTVMFRHDQALTLPREWGHDKFVIKPAISATAYKTMIVTRTEVETRAYQNALIPGDWLCQPFMPQISEGEISLLYFNKSFSHALLKVPKPGDFRVQIEWGGSVESFKPSEELLRLADKIMESVPYDLLYARIDLIPFENTYALMELELIEPALYLRTNPAAAKNLKEALDHV